MYYCTLFICQRMQFCIIHVHVLMHSFKRKDFFYMFICHFIILGTGGFVRLCTLLSFSYFNMSNNNCIRLSTFLITVLIVFQRKCYLRTCWLCMRLRLCNSRCEHVQIYITYLFIQRVCYSTRSVRKCLIPLDETRSILFRHQNILISE